MILWEGASLIDGAPIVVVATVGSKNPKTGDMVQTWILRSDIAPHEAVNTGADASVCGDCKQRRFLGGSCYVTPLQAPLSVYKRYLAGGYEDQVHMARVARALRVRPIRLGAYGDPAAVPFEVWEELIAQGCRQWSGYTHQWRREYAQPFRRLVMASCDTEAEAAEARAMGWRFFLITPDAPASSLPRVVECLSDSRALTCEECGICDGTRADSRDPHAASVAIRVHGALAKRFLNVIR